VICKVGVQVLGADLKGKLVSRLLGTYLAVAIAIGTTGCQQSAQRSSELLAIASSPALTTTDGPISEVKIPASISNLSPSLEKFQPQVRIISPKPDETLADDRVTVKLQVTDLPLFKQRELGLGNHLHVILDKQTYQGVYDLSQPLVFKNLAAGTHSLRVFASRPWHESFKNEGAYAQVSFNVLTKTAENNPNPQQPLLTYSRPAGTYGAEPIMLDYYLTNIPAHILTDGSPDRRSDWRIRVTINEQRFILDRWEPIYLQGFKQGKNWVRLELVDDRGNPIPNVYNDTVGIVTYDPQARDSLARLIQGEIDPELARSLVDPNYIAIKPAPVITPTLPAVPTPASTPAPLPIPIPSPPIPIIPAPVVVTPPPIVKSNPILIAPLPVATPSPTPIAAAPIPPSVPTPIESPVPVIQPSIVPSSPAAPVTIAPAPQLTIASPPVVVIKPSPATETPMSIKPAPAEVPTPNMIVNPLVPNPVLPSQSAPIITPPPTVLANPPINSTPQQPQAPIPTATAPQLENQHQVSWQTQVVDLLNVARAKIREFTNTIPAKAHRFGDTVQIWAGNAKNYTSDRIQEWRNRS
jgi:hypothetical protein